MTAETFDRPGLLGRAIRLTAGLALLTFGIKTLTEPTDWISQTVPQSFGIWIGAAVCFRFLRGMEKGFQRIWGRKPQLIIVLLALVAVLFNMLSYGTWWGIPLGALIFLLIVYVTMNLGVSFLLADILAHPG